MSILSRIRALKARLPGLIRSPAAESVSTNYELLPSRPPVDPDGWRSAAVAERQHEAFTPLLEATERGEPRIDFAVAAQAVDATGLDRPGIVEVGCGSGYYGRIIPLLLGRPVEYLGVDYSPSMVALARERFPERSFVCGDARALPFANGEFDVVLSGTSLMHIVDWESAVGESARVSREWIVFHSVPVIERQATTLLRKDAYGEPVLEVIINRRELEDCFGNWDLQIVSTYDGIPYDVAPIVGERSYSLTYLCRKNR